MKDAITHVIVSAGLIGILVLMLAESCGIPFPSEVVMPAAGFAAATGQISLPAAIVTGAFANLLGSLLAYAIAARFGRPVLLGPGRYVGLRAHHIDVADRWFERFGLPAVFFGRMLPVIRTYISFPAGLARVNIAWFSILTFVGALPWCAALAIAGYQLGANYDRVSGPIEKIAVVIALVVLVGLVAWIARTRRNTTAV